ncbi:MAG: hypothetical protein WBA59_06625 [Moheibacter sp.]
MKNKVFISLFIMLIAMMTTVTSCSDLEEVTENTEQMKSLELKEGFLDEETLLGDNIYLPEGTRWSYTNEQKNEVIFELPEEYIFLLKNVESGEYILSNKGGGYSCSCTGDGNCQVFSFENPGFGCLQNTCVDSCIGSMNSAKEPNLQIVGVLNANNDMLDANISQKKASLSSDGIEGFFKVDEVKNEIKRTYDFLYENIEKPDFESGIYNPDQYLYAKVLLYGFEIGVIIPNDAGLLKLLPNLNTYSFADVKSSSFCNCNDESQEKCNLKKTEISNYTTYYCND